MVFKTALKVRKHLGYFIIKLVRSGHTAYNIVGFEIDNRRMAFKKHECIMCLMIIVTYMNLLYNIVLKITNAGDEFTHILNQFMTVFELLLYEQTVIEQTNM